MIFRTEINPESFSQKINIKDKIFFTGSCFAENIGSFFYNHHFDVCINPFGILYNPVSIANSLNKIINNEEFTAEDLFHFNNKWLSFYHHGKFSDANKEQALSKINTKIRQAYKHLKETKFLFITFGTSWVYALKNNNQIVANCHKIPQQEFNRYRLNVEEIVDIYTKLISQIKKLSPEINIVFTVSPVRHLKDGAHGNQLSKSVLLLAVEELNSLSGVHYFPSYELALDDLRDYRFYAKDMTHLNEIAEQYIWEKLSQSAFDNETLEVLPKINKIFKAVNHRTFNPDSTEYQNFKDKINSKIENLEKQYGLNLFRFYL